MGKKEEGEGRGEGKNGEAWEGENQRRCPGIH